MTLEEQFDEAIEKATFNVFEIRGFMSNPKLAVKAGMAMGYKLAQADFEKMMDKRFPAPGKDGAG